jgi:hypothetical protein
MARGRGTGPASGTSGPYDIEIERDGKTYSAMCTVAGTGPTAMVYISSQWGSPATQVGGQGTEATARMLLGNLIARIKPAEQQ